MTSTHAEAIGSKWKSRAEPSLPNSSPVWRTTGWSLWKTKTLFVEIMVSNHYSHYSSHKSSLPSCRNCSSGWFVYIFPEPPSLQSRKCLPSERMVKGWLLPVGLFAASICTSRCCPICMRGRVRRQCTATAGSDNNAAHSCKGVPCKTGHVFFSTLSCFARQMVK